MYPPKGEVEFSKVTHSLALLIEYAEYTGWKGIRVEAGEGRNESVGISSDRMLGAQQKIGCSSCPSAEVGQSLLAELGGAAPLESFSPPFQSFRASNPITSITV